MASTHWNAAQRLELQIDNPTIGYLLSHTESQAAKKIIEAMRLEGPIVTLSTQYSPFRQLVILGKQK